MGRPSLNGKRLARVTRACQYVLSSGVGKRYIAIWKLDSGKTQSSNCILSMEQPAIFLDCKCSDEGEVHILAISKIGACYFWSANDVDDLRNKKPTKIILAESSVSTVHQAFSIFAAKLQGVDGPNSAHVLLAYGSVAKPSFDKLLVCYGTDINLGISQDGVLLPNTQSTMTNKGQSVKKQETVTALDRANAEDAVLPLPKLHTQENKRKHGVRKPSGDVKPEMRGHLRSLKPGDACKLLENLVSAWTTRSGSTEVVLRWLYCLC
ncbi:transducin family protein / WD-40 repeat family protein [Zea mays]|uniref:Transducin family protein / WD-40 repeat family protein n=1 Tax=Zea mays TaxID=4577 RepID=A0A1D6PCF1_MAIZE|nr:transducin family protein / WD-40 repeat family protein [Zea mays]